MRRPITRASPGRLASRTSIRTCYSLDILRTLASWPRSHVNSPLGADSKTTGGGDSASGADGGGAGDAGAEGRKRGDGGGSCLVTSAASLHAASARAKDSAGGRAGGPAPTATMPLPGERIVQAPAPSGQTNQNQSS